MNLFWATKPPKISMENHLTEFFAAALELSPMLKRKYCTFILEEFARKNG